MILNCKIVHYLETLQPCSYCIHCSIDQAPKGTDPVENPDEYFGREEDGQVHSRNQVELWKAAHWGSSGHWSY
jgi:hypothetical protein